MLLLGELPNTAEDHPNVRTAPGMDNQAIRIQRPKAATDCPALDITEGGVMDQRKCVRKAVALSAVVACPRFGLLRGEIVDLAQGGLYIKAETSIVPIGAEVTVTFQPDEFACTDCLTVRGYVTHQSLHGFGIAFAELEAVCAQALARLLPGKPLAPSRALPVLRAG